MVCTFIISSEGFYGQILTLFVLSTKWPFIFKCCAWSLSRLCLTLCDLMDCGPPDFSVHGILQTRILEWVAMHSSRASSQSRDQTQVSHTAGRFLTIWATSCLQTSVSGAVPPGRGQEQRNDLAWCFGPESALLKELLETLGSRYHFVGSLERTAFTFSLLGCSQFTLA